MTMTWGCAACGHTFPNPPAFAAGPLCPSCGGGPLVSPPPRPGGDAVMEGRWTITHDGEGKARTVTRNPDARSKRNGWGAIPVVPCDDAAVERAAAKLAALWPESFADRGTWHELVAHAVLRAAGETP